MTTFAQLIRADYEELYGPRQESARRRRGLMPLRMAINPSLHAIVMIRAALCGPRPMFGLWRHVLLTTHSLDIERGCRIGPGLTLPHPFGIVISAGSRVGARGTIYHNVCVGAPSPEGATDVDLGDDVVLHTNAVVLGGARVGSDVIVGANSVVQGVVPANAVVRLGQVRQRRSASDRSAAGR